ncbi:MAG: DUF3634 family protein [Gammaproteobacteria bacterium]|nr:DUF3634 family protein [Gammaproteobacteria bacterium]
MDTLTIIIVGVSAILIFDAFLIFHLKKKRKDSFKIIVEKAKVTQNTGNTPPEFLYDIQQLARINNVDTLIINGSKISSGSPNLEVKGNISQELQEKIEHSLELSLQ